MISRLCRINLSLPLNTATYSTAASNNVIPKTAIVMLNMGGPQTTDQVGDYLHRIMTDRDMIQLPVQSKLGPWIASRRTEEVKKKYMEIGGGSPILKWTNIQGNLLTQALDQMLPESAPHKHYVAFRYVPPFTEDALEQIEKDGVKRAVIFSQYPQYSCATTGSSLNAIADFYRNRQVPSGVKFSMIERWGTHPLLAPSLCGEDTRKTSIVPRQSERGRSHLVHSAQLAFKSSVSRRHIPTRSGRHGGSLYEEVGSSQSSPPRVAVQGGPSAVAAARILMMQSRRTQNKEGNT
ncbi:hypothetical protein ACJJTC_017308 [Scirpophaga incertulas]